MLGNKYNKFKVIDLMKKFKPELYPILCMILLFFSGFSLKANADSNPLTPSTFATLPPDMQKLLLSQGGGTPNTGGQVSLPSGLQQQRQLMDQINNNPQQNPVLAKNTINPNSIPSGNSNTVVVPTPMNTAQAFSAMEQQSFEQSLRDFLPMTPDQIREVKRKMLQTQRASVGYYLVPPKPISTSLAVDLSPGAQPPVIRLSEGFVSSLVFVDATGAPWPVESYDLGNPAAFNIQWDQKSNTLMIQANTTFTYGNLAVKLIGMNTPVVLTLTPGQKVVDYRVDLRIQGQGPNAQPLPINEWMPVTEGKELLSVLEGLAPVGSKMLEVKGGAAQAWLFADKIYLRTRLPVLSPGWLATLSSADGMRAYILQRTSTILVSQNAKPVQIKIEGF